MDTSNKKPGMLWLVLVLVLGVNVSLAILWWTVHPRPASALPDWTTRTGDYRNREIVPQVMSRFDADGDGKISRQEFVRYGVASDFDRYDKNHDGFLDAREYEQAFNSEDPNPLAHKENWVTRSPRPVPSPSVLPHEEPVRPAGRVPTPSEGFPSAPPTGSPTMPSSPSPSP